MRPIEADARGPKEGRARGLCLLRDLGVSLLLFTLLCVATYVMYGKATAILGVLLAMSGFLLLSGLEWVLPVAGPRKSGARWWLHVQLMLSSVLLGILFGAWFGIHLPGIVSDLLGIQPGIIDVEAGRDVPLWKIVFFAFAGIAVYDFFYYWYHRAMHASAILWQHHKIHHMDVEFDALTGLRNGWLETVFVGIAVACPVAILFRLDGAAFTPDSKGGIVIFAVTYLISLARVINHSNLRIQFGRLSCLWVSSQTHRIHHSLLTEHRDRNFAAHFPLWDILFGTYRAPKLNEFPPTGVSGEKEISSLWDAQTRSIRDWRSMFLSRQRRTCPGKGRVPTASTRG